MFTHKDADQQHIQTYRNEIRRKIHIMLAFVRQNTRESHVGFQPNSSEAATPFHEGNNYVRDPTRPRLCDLLTPTEVEAYGKVIVSARAACVASEIKGIVQLLAKHVEYNFMVRLCWELRRRCMGSACLEERAHVSNPSLPLQMYTKVSQCLQLILDGQETLFRIITTPLPFPYHWILNAMLIIFGTYLRARTVLTWKIDGSMQSKHRPIDDDLHYILDLPHQSMPQTVYSTPFLYGAPVTMINDPACCT